MELKHTSGGIGKTMASQLLAADADVVAANANNAISMNSCSIDEGVYVSAATLEHHFRYLGRTAGFFNRDGSRRVPTPAEVVQLGWEPASYLDQFAQA